MDGRKNSHLVLWTQYKLENLKGSQKMCLHHLVFLWKQCSIDQAQQQNLWQVKWIATILLLHCCIIVTVYVNINGKKSMLVSLIVILFDSPQNTEWSIWESTAGLA